MKNEVFEDSITKLNLQKNEWLLFDEIDSIILQDGRGIYPDWKHLRFFISDSNEIYIQHGISSPYGAKLSNNFRVNMGYMSLSFLPGLVVSRNEYHGDFRLPKNGDILVCSLGKNKIIGQTLITSAKAYSNTVNIDLMTSLQALETPDVVLSFYDPTLYDQRNCIHGTEIEGVYMKFTPNIGKKSKICGVFHEIIKPKNIKEINLKLNAPYKVFKLE